MHRRFERAVRSTEQRVGARRRDQVTLRYVFPDHWSFLLGEIALYSFIVLVGDRDLPDPLLHPERLAGHLPRRLPAAPGRSRCPRPTARCWTSSFNVPAGLLIRQVHHWAADVFIASIVLHLVRIFFTGAYRKPRDFNYYIGLTMLMLAILEGFAGYSLVDDLLSGMGLAIAYGVAMSIPFIGGQLASLIWGGRFPGHRQLLAAAGDRPRAADPAALAT